MIGIDFIFDWLRIWCLVFILLLREKCKIIIIIIKENGKLLKYEISINFCFKFVDIIEK